MIVDQISVFIENKKGRLSEIADVLANNSIDISALSLADTDEYGVLRMIVSNPHDAKRVLGESGVVAKVSPVLAVAIDDRPGGFSGVMDTLTEKGIEIKYMYACLSHEAGKALMIFSVEDPGAADKILEESGVGKVKPSSIYRI